MPFSAKEQRLRQRVVRGCPGPPHQRGVTNCRQATVLASGRETLLPEPISGQLRVSCAQSTVGRAGF